MTAPGTAREEHEAMEFSVTKSALLNELNTTQGVVERKTTIPILSNLLVEAKGSSLTITATDLELSIRTSCEARSEGRRWNYSCEETVGARPFARSGSGQTPQ
jgi:DNA polymerase III sliding clamp (beta) subunit (PCNA family)